MIWQYLVEKKKWTIYHLSNVNQTISCSANKLRPKASENVKLPDPLPECISKMNQTTELYCSICELSVNSQQQLTQHLGSTKHKLVSLGLLPKPSEDPNIKRVVSVQNYEKKTYRNFQGQYKCKICDVILNSEAQLVQHLKSLRHQVPVKFTYNDIDNVLYLLLNVVLSTKRVT